MRRARIVDGRLSTYKQHMLFVKLAFCCLMLRPKYILYWGVLPSAKRPDRAALRAAGQATSGKHFDGQRVSRVFKLLAVGLL